LGPSWPRRKVAQPLGDLRSFLQMGEVGIVAEEDAEGMIAGREVQAGHVGEILCPTLWRSLQAEDSI
jgi:hypothetical protein